MPTQRYIVTHRWTHPDLEGVHTTIYEYLLEDRELAEAKHEKLLRDCNTVEVLIEIRDKEV